MCPPGSDVIDISTDVYSKYVVRCNNKDLCNVAEADPDAENSGDSGAAVVVMDGKDPNEGSGSRETTTASVLLTVISLCALKYF